MFSLNYKGRVIDNWVSEDGRDTSVTMAYGNRIYTATAHCSDEDINLCNRWVGWTLCDHKCEEMYVRDMVEIYKRRYYDAEIYYEAIHLCHDITALDTLDEVFDSAERNLKIAGRDYDFIKRYHDTIVSWLKDYRENISEYRKQTIEDVERTLQAIKERDGGE